MRRSKPDLKDRERLVDYAFNQRKTVAAAAPLLDVEKRTVYSILSRFEKENRIELKNRVGVNRPSIRILKRKLSSFSSASPMLLWSSAEDQSREIRSITVRLYYQ